MVSFRARLHKHFCSAPRLVRAIAEDRSIKGLEYFEVTWGASKVPVRAILLVGLVAIVFLLAGDINTIAPIIANAFLLVYGVTCYANFCLSKAYHERKRREKLQGTKKRVKKYYNAAFSSCSFWLEQSAFGRHVRPRSARYDARLSDHVSKCSTRNDTK